MKTLWISILGFSSGRTGLVVNNGGPPYLDGTRTPSGLSDIVCRFDKDGCETLLGFARQADEIRVLGYSDQGAYRAVTLVEVEEALDPWQIAEGEKSLVSLIPDD